MNSRKKFKIQNNFKKSIIKQSVNQIKEEKQEFRSNLSEFNNSKRSSYDSENNNVSIKFRPLINDQSNRIEQDSNSFISYPNSNNNNNNNNSCEIDHYGDDNQELIRNKQINNLRNETKRIRLESSINRNNSSTQKPTEDVVKSLIKCAVCNDSASGTRYGVCVCEGCKEFFR